MPDPGLAPAPSVPTAEATPGPLLVLVALAFEARQLARGWRRARPDRGGDGGGLVITQVGLAAADLPRLERVVLGRRPTAVLVTGLAGGCAPDLAPGDIVVASEVGPMPSGAWLTPAAELVERAVAALQTAGLAYRVGRLLTAPSLVATPEAKANCWRRHQALAVDMESARVLAWAERAGIPALAVRAIADGSAEALPPALARLIGPDGVIRPRVALECAARPAVVGAAWRLWRRSRRALDGLGRFLAAFISLQP